MSVSNFILCFFVVLVGYWLYRYINKCLLKRKLLPLEGIWINDNIHAILPKPEFNWEHRNAFLTLNSIDDIDDSWFKPVKPDLDYLFLGKSGRYFTLKSSSETYRIFLRVNPLLPPKNSPKGSNAKSFNPLDIDNGLHPNAVSGMIICASLKTGEIFEALFESETIKPDIILNFYRYELSDLQKSYLQKTYKSNQGSPLQTDSPFPNENSSVYAKRDNSQKAKINCGKAKIKIGQNGNITWSLIEDNKYTFPNKTVLKEIPEYLSKHMRGDLMYSSSFFYDLREHDYNL